MVGREAIVTVTQGTDGMMHPPDGGLHDHHAAPTQVTIDDTTTSIPPGSTANVDITLPRPDYQLARILIHGPKAAVGSIVGNSGYEGAFIMATTVASDASGCAARDAGALRMYGGHWSKQDGSSILTDYVFDSNTSLTSRYIAVQDAYITGSTLRLVMVNSFGGSATVWVKGIAVLL
jgi:hypothetical protein